VAQQRSWLVVERLPAYAPDLNPVEGVWSNLKGVELANLVTEHLGDIIRAAEAGIDRIRRTPQLAYGFLHSCGLKAW
jgi:transposase